MTAGGVMEELGNNPHNAIVRGVLVREAVNTRRGSMLLYLNEEIWMGSERIMARSPALPSISQQEPTSIWTSETTYGGTGYTRAPFGDSRSQLLFLVPRVGEVSSMRTRAPSPKWAKFRADVDSRLLVSRVVTRRRRGFHMAGTSASRAATRARIHSESSLRAVKRSVRELNKGGILTSETAF